MSRHVAPLGNTENTSPCWVCRTCGVPASLYEVHNGYLWFNPNIKAEDAKLPLGGDDRHESCGKNTTAAAISARRSS